MKLSSQPFQIETDVLMKVFYHEQLTLIAGKKFSAQYPSFSSIGITPEPNPSVVVTLNSSDGLMFMLKEIEGLRKRYGGGMWSPGRAIMGEKVRFNFFTHNSEKYLSEFLQLLGNQNKRLLREILKELETPKVTKIEPIDYQALKKKFSYKQVVLITNTASNASEAETYIKNFISLFHDELDTFKHACTSLAHIAVEKQFYSLFKLLINAGANLNQKDGNGDSLLTMLTQKIDQKSSVDLLEFSLRSYAAQNNIQIVKALIVLFEKFSLNINAAGAGSKMTALHRASKAGNIEIREFLIAAGADPTIPDGKNKSPNDYIMLNANSNNNNQNFTI